MGPEPPPPRPPHEDSALAAGSSLPGWSLVCIRSAGLRAAVAFSKFVLSIDGAQEAMVSRRAAGASFEAYCTKRETVQREPLLVTQVLGLMDLS